MDFRKHIGLHIRLNDSILQATEEAQRLGLKTFQFFLSQCQKNNTSNYMTISTEEKKQFIALKAHFSMIYVHTSYWINPASGKPNSYAIAESLLRKEIRLAQRLELHHLVLHPGSATWHQPTPDDPICRQAGIDSIVRMLNTVTKEDPEVIIILENTAHANRAIGSDLNDLKLIREKLDRPEQLRFCLDLAHAFSYGYALEDIDTMVSILDATMGLANLELIHFNDSQEKFGSKKDKHAYPGYGLIGKKTMQAYLHHPALQPLNKILEVPQSSTEHAQTILNELYSW